MYLGTFIDDEEDWQYEDEVRKYCQDVCIVRLNPLSARIRSLFALFGNDPLTLAYYRDARLMQWIKALFSNESIQDIVVSLLPWRSMLNIYLVVGASSISLMWIRINGGSTLYQSSGRSTGFITGNHDIC